MKNLFLIVLLALLMGCANAAKPNEWECFADINKDSVRVKIDCSKIGEVCKTGKYRVMKIFPTQTIYVYSVDPKTDMDKFFKGLIDGVEDRSGNTR
jgi:hypothetical protein